MRLEFDAGSLPARHVYRLLTSLVIPRPIAWVSTLDASGTANLAPHSFFTVASSDPGIVQFTSVTRKDTLRNIEATGEFVVNLAPRRLLDAVNLTSTPFPDGVNEFDVASLAMEPSLSVSVPRVAESPAALECQLHRVIEVGNSFLVLGLVTHVAINESVLDEAGHPRPGKLDPLSRLGSNEWGTLGEVLALDRITLEQWRSAQEPTID
ncbi:flavin reductase family protein [Paeniglutamicibacter cryotolerans]|uniref:Flavin reductase (DIM6/NTAB) family NADH-FMN oxidoreductase RutF n=1 Tax=Paeniglutamicibacter cryotolerans TaxID=670079 RepID=A0A839QGF2_9MICC|nr:flavin reductase family protein [Paeniglutamicibacter cryotolerans]MBB2994777.1 flavin reductase (DIM6/NTAB) family NADH-FMN oxidoreductase RutF [Paeniglutamicibacter cryotolerans]